MRETITTPTRTHRIHPNAVAVPLRPIPAIGKLADRRTLTVCGQHVDGVAGVDQPVTCGNCQRSTTS